MMATKSFIVLLDKDAVFNNYYSAATLIYQTFQKVELRQLISDGFCHDLSNTLHFSRDFLWLLQNSFGFITWKCYVKSSGPATRFSKWGPKTIFVRGGAGGVAFPNFRQFFLQFPLFRLVFALFPNFRN